MNRMKNLIVTTLLSFLIINTYAQSYNTIYEVVNLKEEVFYLNSKTRVGGKIRTSIKIDLPENTVEWYYVFTTKLNKSDTKSNIGLASQLTKIVSKGTGVLIDISSQVLYQAIKPTGIGVVDVYLTDYNGYQQFHDKDFLGIPKYISPNSYKEGSGENRKDALIKINDVNQGTVYLCFKNPSPLEGVLVNLEVAAIVAKEEYVNEWTLGSKQFFTDKCLGNFVKKDEKEEQVCNCFSEKIVETYDPSTFNSFTENQKEEYYRTVLELCYETTGNIEVKDSNKRLEELTEDIRGLRIAKDYENLRLRYEEMLSLGIENDQIYNSLGWYCLLTNRLEDAKKYLIKGLGKSPHNLYLQGNLANYFLLTGDYKNAEEIYLKYKKHRFVDRMKWKDAVGEDLKLFESLGMYNSDFERVRKVLKIKKKK